MVEELLNHGAIQGWERRSGDELGLTPLHMALARDGSSVYTLGSECRREVWIRDQSG